ncbi:hypothetical protein QJQ45_000142 [Haematococcus lacustris]|nr:hypothetical protein QJQ45_000142 [Haematococcus lacustris]
MSKSGSQGGRKDIALLRKLKSQSLRDPTFQPSSLLGEGNGLLEKADKLKSFLKQQKSRTDTSTAKTEWILAAQQMQEEREALEQDVAACLISLEHLYVEQGLGSELQEATAQWHTSCQETANLKVQLRGQVSSLSRTCRGLKSLPSAAKARAAAAPAQRQLLSLKEDLAQQLHGLADAVAAKVAEVNEAWPSALATKKDLSCGLPSQLPADEVGMYEVLGEHDGLVTEGYGSERRSESGATEPPGSRGSTLEASWLVTQGDQLVLPATSRASATAGPPSEQDKSGVGDRVELEACIALFPLTDAAIKDRVRAVYDVLKQQHLLKMAEWQAQMMAGGELLASATDQHSQFVALRERYWREAASRGTGREAVLRKLHLVMPGWTFQQLLAHDDWLAAHKTTQRKRKDLVDAWCRERAQFLEDSKALLQEASDSAVAQAQAAADKLLHELERERVHEQLAEHVAQAAHAAALEAAEAAAAAPLLAAAKEAALQAAAAEAAARKLKVAEYRARLELQHREAATAAAALAERAAEQAAQQASYNRERLQWRQAEQACKEEKAREAKEAQEREAQAREERLARLRALVAPDVAADPARLLLPTDASSAVDEATPGAFRPMHGYTSEQMFRDPRFKVIKVPGGAVLRGCKKTKRKLLAHLQSQAEVHSQLHVHLAAASSAGTSLVANLKHITVTLATWDAVWEVYLDPKWARQRLRLYESPGPCAGAVLQAVAPRKPPQAPCSSQEATQPAASEPGPSTPPPAKGSKRTEAEQAAEPTQPTKAEQAAELSKGKAA